MAFTKTAGVEYGTPEVVLSTTAAAGSNQTAIRTDGQLIAFTTDVPETIAYGQSAATGSDAVASRLDHKHGMAAADGVDPASVAEMEAASSNTVFATPGRTQNHPGVAKAWVRYEQTGDHEMAASYNMTSVSDGGGAGDSDLLWGTPFSSADYAIVSMTERSYCCGNDGGAGQPATTGVNIITFDTTTYAGTDINFNFVAAFGDQ
jgi:hypothetical protein